MRNIVLGDCFKLSRIILSLGIKEELQKIASEKDGKNVKEVGFDIIFALLSKATTKDAEKKICEFLGDILEKKDMNVSDIDITSIIEEFEDNENLKILINFTKKAIQ